MAKNESKKPEDKNSAPAVTEQAETAPAAKKPKTENKPLDNVVPFDKKDEKEAPPVKAAKVDKSAKAVTPKNADKAQAGKPLKESAEKKPVTAEVKPKQAEGPTLKERKQKLEKELREKYGIPKSSKNVQPWVAPEVEKVVRIPHEQLHSFKDHPFNVDKDTKFMAFTASIREHGVTQPVIVRPDGKDDGF